MCRIQQITPQKVYSFAHGVPQRKKSLTSLLPASRREQLLAQAEPNRKSAAPLALSNPLPQQLPLLVFQPLGHPKQALIDGELWPPVFQPEAVRSAKKLRPLASDVFVCTYPKCGTTWIQHICSQLLYAHTELGQQQQQQGGNELCLRSPMIERMGADYCDRQLQQQQQPRLLKTHFSRANCPTSAHSQTKYIFAVRNPKDCCVSYFHHCRNFKLYDWADGRFDTFFELFLRGALAFGDYFDHLLGWLPHLAMEKDSGAKQLLFLKYEDMVADLEAAVRRIGLFLGGRAAQLVQDPVALANVVAESRVDAMRRDQSRWFPGSQLHNQQSFIRKGSIRDWKNHMSRKQSDRMDELCSRRLAGTVAEGWWREEMRWEDNKCQREESAGGEEDSGLESSDENILLH